MGFQLRDYQQRATAATLNFLYNEAPTTKNGILVAPTGAGKSLIVSEVSRFIGKSILVLQPSKELLKQNFDKYTKLYGLDATIFSASLGKKEISPVVFGTPGSVINSVDLFKKANVDYLIIDECHLKSRIGGDMHKIIKALKPKKVVGLTATPVYLLSGGGDWAISELLAQKMREMPFNTPQYGQELKMMNRTSKSFFKHMIHVTQVQELTKKGFWSPLIYENRYVDDSMLEWNSSGSDYTGQSMEEMYAANNTHENILSEVEALRAEGRKSILIFVPSIADAEALTEQNPLIEVVHSKISKAERDRIVNGFTSGEIPVVVNVMVLATGFDHPELDAIIHARPTSSIQLYYQTVGRGVRIHPLKPDCKVVDLAGNELRFGRVEDIVIKNLEGYGWGMFSGKRLLTGVPLKGPEITEADLLEAATEEDVSGFKMPWGKFSGKTLAEVFQERKNYLEWIAGPDFEAGSASAKEVKKNAKLFLAQLA